MRAMLGVHDLELLLFEEDADESMDVGRALGGVICWCWMGVFLLLQHLTDAVKGGAEEKAGLVGWVEAEGAARLEGRCLSCFLHSLRFFDGKVYILISFFDEGRNINPKLTSIITSPSIPSFYLLNPTRSFLPPSFPIFLLSIVVVFH